MVLMVAYLLNLDAFVPTGHTLVYAFLGMKRDGILQITCGYILQADIATKRHACLQYVGLRLNAAADVKTTR